MTKRKSLVAILLTGFVGSLLAGSAGSVPAMEASTPLNVATAAVYNVNEMSDRGPLPLLAIFPDGRVTFRTLEGDFKVVRYTTNGTSTLVANLRSSLTPRPPVSPPNSAIASLTTQPTNTSDAPLTAVVVENCPSDVGEIEVAFFGEQPRVAYCEKDFRELERISAVLSSVVANTAVGRIDVAAESAKFARYAVIARRASKAELGKRPLLATWRGPKLNLARGSDPSDGSCTVVKGSPPKSWDAQPLAWRTPSGLAYLSMYPIVDGGKWCRKQLPPPGQMTSAESQIFVDDRMGFVVGEIRVRFTGKLAEVHGGNFFLREVRSGNVVAFLRAASGNNPASSTTDPALQNLIDNGLVGPGPEVLKSPPGLKMGRYELCQNEVCVLLYL
jgi:hypothetical protein